MTSTPLVSIVLPVYNGGRYLGESIQSCLDQSYTNWELIIVDDASTDATPQIIEEWVRCDARLRSFRHERNRKLPAALNTGFVAARGDYFTWTSDDNRYRPHALATLVDFLEEKLEVDIVYTNYTVIDESGKPVRLARVEGVDVLPFKNPVGASFLYRAAVGHAVGLYDEELFRAEDYDFWMRAACISTLYPLHEDLYEYRLHGASLNVSQSPQCHLATAWALLRNLPQMGGLTDAVKARAYLLAGLRFQIGGESGEASNALKIAFEKYGVLDHACDFALEHFIYWPVGLRSEEDMCAVLSVLPEGQSYARFRQQLWGRYFGERCFDELAKGQAHGLRRLWRSAVRYHPAWLTNLGFLRIGLRAYAPIRSS